MKFDVIVGNPPYQLGVGNEGGNSSKAKAIYHHFISQAMKLNPRYLTMIVPSRWMTRSTEGIPDEWVDTMLNDKRIRIIHDFLDAKMVFSGTPPKGGVNYFLWDREHNGKCHYVLYMNSSDNNPSINDDYLDSKNAGIVIRDVKSLSIIDKIEKTEKDYIKNDNMNFSGMVSPKDFFTNKEFLTSSWRGYSQTKNSEYAIKYYLNKSIHKISFGWIKKYDVPKHTNSIKLHKVYIAAAAQGDIMESDNQILGYPFYGEPDSVCSQTYLVIGYDPERHNYTELQCRNIISYIKTKFFRYLVSIKKKTQNGPRQVYQFVPMQDFSEPWTDEKLYAKYGITAEEQAFIESMIRPMETQEEK
jgi:site-specific DNA-methyltransferase (adenine-specific)